MPIAKSSNTAINVRLEMLDRATCLTGFGHFWLKRVVGFYPSQHCAGCLKGSYVEGVVGVNMPADVDLQFAAAAGELFYLCGVASPTSGQTTSTWSSGLSPVVVRACRCSTGVDHRGPRCTRLVHRCPGA